MAQSNRETAISILQDEVLPDLQAHLAQYLSNFQVTKQVGSKMEAEIMNRLSGHVRRAIELLRAGP